VWEPPALEWRVAATRSCSDGGEELEHDGEAPGEARARRGGPKGRGSTTQDAKEPKQRCNTGAATQ
jgi:hypothetical protein